MGCGVSRPVIEADAPVPPGLSPIRRRIEEIKRQRRTHKRSKSHLSSRELLGDEERITLTSNADDEHYEDAKSVPSSPLESIREVEQGANPFEEKPEKMEKVEVVVRQPPQPQLIENVGGNPLVEKAILAAKRDEEEEQRGDHHEQHHQDEEEDPDTDDEALWDNGSDIGPGSPSFREYCSFTPDHSADSDDEIPKDDGKHDGEKVEERGQTDDRVGSSEGSGNVLVKKGHKGRKFKRVLPKGGQAAMKNFLNVKSCYTPPCSSHHHSHSHSNVRVVMPATTG